MNKTIHENFTDFDELAAKAEGWNLELCKLDRGTFFGELFQWITEGFILSRGRFQSHLRQEGQPPTGLRTMTVHVEQEMSQYWRGRQVDGNNLMVFPLNSEVDTVSDPKFDIFTVSFDEDALLAQAESMGCGSIETALKDKEVLRCDPQNLARMRRYLFGFASKAQNTVIGNQDLKHEIQSEVIHLLGRTEGSGRTRHRCDRRLRIIHDAQGFLADNLGEAVTVGDLSRAAGVSIRTLQYAFQDHIGVSPKAYINALRLNAARKELKSNPGNAGYVADIANRYGFWHLGQFAADYRRLFGENPSQT